MSGVLEGEEAAEDRWAAVAVGGEEAVGVPPEVQGDLCSAEQVSRPAYSTAAVQHRRLDAKMVLNIRPGVHHRTHYHCCRAVTQTGAVSGAASAAAASAGGVALGGWRTWSRRRRGHRSRRNPLSVLRGRRQVASGAQALQSFVTGVPHSLPRRETLLKSRISNLILIVTLKRRGGARGLCVHIQPGLRG